MAYDELKAKAMRGDPEPDPADPAEESEGEGPSEEDLAAAKRLCLAVEGKNYRAIVAAVKDLG
jgi:hypothetical protein